MPTKSRLIPPRTIAGEEPQLFRIGEYNFQKLIRDIVSAEDGVATASVYGIRGQSQYGVDVVIRLKNDFVEVAQCKCHQKIKAREIVKASDDFLINLNKWQAEGKGITRFILAVACDMSGTALQTQITAQRKRFAEHNISYEAWDAGTIQNKLRPLRGVVATYFDNPQYWIQVICGPDARADEVINATAEFELAQARRWMLEGRDRDVSDWLKEIHSPRRWNPLGAEIRANIQVFEARLAVLDGRLSRAKVLAQETKAHANPAMQTRLEALISLYEDGPDVALKTLDSAVDRDSQDFRAIIYLQLGREREALHCLSDTAATIEPSAETYRVRALVHLLHGKYGAARSAINASIEREPRREVVRLSAAMIDYFEGIAESPILAEIQGGPFPIPIQVVRQDSASVDGFRRAARLFREVASSHESGSGTWRFGALWAAAAMANDFARIEDCESYCAEVLRSDPLHIQIIQWILQRDLRVDISVSANLLQKRYDANVATIHEVNGLVAIDLNQSRPEHALERLVKTKDRFVADGQIKMWMSRYAQALTALNREAEALEILPSDDPDFADQRVATQQHLEQRTGNIEGTLAAHKQLFDLSGSPLDLYGYAQALGVAKKWESVLELSDDLLQRLKTPNALVLVARAAHNVGDHEKALRLIKEQAPLLITGELPPDLMRIEALSHAALGNINSAIDGMASLLNVQRSVSNLLLYAQMLQRVGDLKQLAIVAREIKDSPTIEPEQQLLLGRLVSGEEPETARELWRNAVSRGVPDDYIIATMLLGYQLGLDDEMKPIIARMQLLGAQRRSGVQLFSIEELPQQVQRIHEAAGRLGATYMEGAAPIHVIAPQANRTLVELYTTLLSRNRNRNGLERTPLLVRHAGRPYGNVVIPEGARLRLDITSLLLADHFELLARVEQRFKPIFLSPYTQTALESMLHELAEKRSSFEDGSADLIGAFQAGLIDVLSDETTVDLAISLGGDRNIEGSVYAMLQALQRDGVIDAPKSDEILARLGITVRDAKPIRPGSTIEFDRFVALILAQYDLLRDLSQRYRLFMSPVTLQEVRALHDGVGERTEQIKITRELLNRLRIGLGTRTYEFLPETSEAQTQEFGPSIEARSLRTLLEGALASDVICVDDRSINAYLHVDGAPIITFADLVETLRGEHEEEYYEMLHRMRQSDLRFMPIQANEILYWLLKADFSEDGLYETRQLTTLRQYIANAIASQTFLQPTRSDESAPNQNGETLYLPLVFHAIVTALSDIWTQHKEDGWKKASSDWILANLYTHNLEVRADEK